MPEIKNLSDEEVVKQVQESNQELYAIIIDRYQAKLIRYVFNLIKDKDKAEDVVQETFIRAYVNLNIFNAKNKFSSWIYQIAHNQTINHIKKHQREVPLPDEFDSQSEEDLQKNFEQKEVGKRVNFCLEKIPLLYREPLYLYFLEEKSYQEISDILRMPMGTVATRINRAKKIYKEICPEE
jgi:RNA polymerase sigma-70 factor (ECF subfamily)